jgi:N utilization substance protein B
MKNRHMARELVLQLLYQRELAGKDGDAADSPEALLEGKHLTGSAGEFCEALVYGVVEHVQELDDIIEPYCEHWSIDRMGVVDRNILRIGVFEIRFMDDIPFKVSIDEEVEVAKLFGSDDSGSFINGILDSIAKDLKIDKQEA